MSLSSLTLPAPTFRLASKRARPQGFAPPFAVAVALHAALIALLLVAIRPQPLPELAEPPAFTMVFAPEALPEPPTPAPQAESEPTPPIAEAPPPPPVEAPLAPAEPPPAVEAPPEPPPPSEATALPEPLPPPPPVAEPAPVPLPAPPVVQPAPPPPPPPVQAKPPQRPVVPPRPAAAPPHPAPRPAARAPRVPEAAPAPGLPYAPASPTPAPAAPPAPAPASAPAAPTVSAGWRSAVISWLQGHRTYPEAALSEGVEGHPSIHFTVAHDGRVLEVGLARSSGSRVLDEAAMALLRGAHLPPFPTGMASETVNLTLPLDYVIQ